MKWEEAEASYHMSEERKKITTNRYQMRQRAELTDRVLKHIVNNPGFRHRARVELAEHRGAYPLRRMAVEEGVISQSEMENVGWKTLGQVLSRMGNPTK